MLRKLLIRPGGIGDCILAIPAMEYLRSDFTEVWVPSPVVPLIQFAERVRAISSTGLDVLGLPGVIPDAGLLKDLRSFDQIVSWYGSNREDFRDAVAALQLPFEFLEALPDASGSMHCCDFFLKRVGGLIGGCPNIHFESVHRMKFAAIHPFSGSHKKNWPIHYYRELAARLPLPVSWCAGPEEQLPDTVRMDDLYELGRWLSSARVYIGNDSGITHLAAASGAPVVAIFGPSDPAVWAPRGGRVRIVSGTLENITVEEVLNAVSTLL
ncbi:MAG: glycosyltransferase family 9 protein [Acidobacteriota bacterium]|nr:glycosyltransferase family 9 protein [Acidobacteriota bacterium]